MKDIVRALYKCYTSFSSCQGCPYEHDTDKCDNLLKNVATVFEKIGEFIDFDDVKNITEIIIKKGEEIKNERKN